MDHRKFSREICRELQERGYQTQMDLNHKHPQLLIRCPDDPPSKRAMVLMSTTANYDIGGLARKKWRDVEKALQAIGKPKPITKEGKVNTSTLAKSLAQGVAQMNPNHPSLRQEQRPASVQDAKPEETRPARASDELVSYPLRIYLLGKNLTLSLEKTTIDMFPEHARNVSLMLTAQKQLIIHFNSRGAVMKNTVSPKFKTYGFAPGSVAGLNWPSQLGRYKLFVRRKGDSLVTVDPLPADLLGGVPHASDTKQAAPAKTPFKATNAMTENGRVALGIFNEWLKEAYEQGLEPEVAFDGKHTIKVKVAERRKVEL